MGCEQSFRRMYREDLALFRDIPLKGSRPRDAAASRNCVSVRRFSTDWLHHAAICFRCSAKKRISRLSLGAAESEDAVQTQYRAKLISNVEWDLHNNPRARLWLQTIFSFREQRLFDARNRTRHSQAFVLRIRKIRTSKMKMFRPLK